MARESNPGIYGKLSRFGSLSQGPSLGLFDSRTRPGMRSSMGSLGGSSLGDAMLAQPPEPGAAAPAAAPAAASSSSNTMLYLGLGAAALGAWYFFIKK